MPRCCCSIPPAPETRETRCACFGSLCQQLARWPAGWPGSSRNYNRNIPTMRDDRRCALPAHALPDRPQGWRRDCRRWSCACLLVAEPHPSQPAEPRGARADSRVPTCSIRRPDRPSCPAKRSSCFPDIRQRHRSTPTAPNSSGQQESFEVVVIGARLYLLGLIVRYRSCDGHRDVLRADPVRCCSGRQPSPIAARAAIGGARAHGRRSWLALLSTWRAARAVRRPTVRRRCQAGPAMRTDCRRHVRPR